MSGRSSSGWQALFGVTLAVATLLWLAPAYRQILLLWAIVAVPIAIVLAAAGAVSLARLVGGWLLSAVASLIRRTR
jgi:hypothetical protein